MIILGNLIIFMYICITIIILLTSYTIILFRVYIISNK